MHSTTPHSIPTEYYNLFSMEPFSTPSGRPHFHAHPFAIVFPQIFLQFTLLGRRYDAFRQAFQHLKGE